MNTKDIQEMWDKRYAQPEYAYGTEPNAFFKTALATNKPKGKILMFAEGEGRNAVYAAEQGLQVTAVDISQEAKRKALQLAHKKNVSIDYLVGDIFKMDLPKNSFDAAGLIFAHFPPGMRENIQKKISELLRPNGIAIIEAFSKNNLPYREKNPNIGGPQNIEFLYTTEILLKDFKDFKTLLLEEKETELNEGLYHVGKGMVVRYIGQKTEN